MKASKAHLKCIAEVLLREVPQWEGCPKFTEYAAKGLAEQILTALYGLERVVEVDCLETDDGNVKYVGYRYVSAAEPLKPPDV